MQTDRPEVLTPYSEALGIRIESQAEQAPVLRVPFESIVQGRPGVFHGGAISGLLETAGYAAIRSRLASEGRSGAQLKPINIAIQFLAAAKSETLFAQARITKLGRRNANVEVECWQADRSRPRATAVMNVLVVGPESD